jgi:flagellar basal body-associated protein FliL
MKKEVKIILYCVLAVILIAVLCIIVWLQSKNEAWEPDDDIIETNLEEVAEVDIVQPETSDNFEQDVMNDLESFFNNNNGYENIQWEFWFVSN